MGGGGGLTLQPPFSFIMTVLFHNELYLVIVVYILHVS